MVVLYLGVIRFNGFGEFGMESLVKEEKRAVAKYASSLVKDGQVVGLGSGSTAALFIVELGKRVKREGLEIIGIPTSKASEELARKEGIKISTLDEYPELDLDVDGADEVDPELNLIKGLGACMLREKVIAAASKLFVVIVDHTKLVDRLGSKHPVPVEVLPFSLGYVKRKLRELGYKFELRLGKNGEPLVTDNGNYVLHVYTGPMENPEEVDETLRNIPGILETGIFPGMANLVCVGKGGKVEVLKRR